MASPSPPPPPLPGPSSELSSTLGASACAYPSCGTHSFLPTVCSCLLSFCPPHAFPPAAHACPVDPATRMMGRDNIASPDARGRFEQKFADLLPDRDRRVDRSAEERAREERRERAAVVLARHREAVALAVKGKHAQVQGEGEVAAAGVVCAVPARGVKPKLVPKKVLSPALELARLKAKAKAAEPRRVNVEVGERWYLNVIHCQGEVEVARTELWMHKVTLCSGAPQSCVHRSS